MNSLTVKQITALDEMTSHLKPDPVALGTKLQEVISLFPGAVNTQTAPVNAVNSHEHLTLTGVVVDGEVVAINNPLVSGGDVYEFCTDAAQTKTDPTNINVNISAHATKSSGSLTLTTQPDSGDKITIGEKEFTFVPAGTANADGEVSVGANLAGAQAAFEAAVNGTDDHNTPHPLVSASAFAANVCTVTALVGGTVGDTIPTTTSLTQVLDGFSAVTLGGGADCTAANAIEHLVAAITANDTQGVSAADAAGDVVDLTANIAGVSGNDITVATTMANGSWGHEHLQGGVDGTVGYVEKPLIDNSYLYVCFANNTISDKNWRRISLGAAY